jgi:hypothetical protein
MIKHFTFMVNIVNIFAGIILKCIKLVCLWQEVGTKKFLLRVCSIKLFTLVASIIKLFVAMIL